MLEVWFGVCLGLLLASNVALWIKLNACHTGLIDAISKTGSIVENKIDMGEIREEIAATVDEFLGGLHVPTGIDHMWGMLAQVGGSILHRKFGNIAPQIQEMVENVAEEI
tara:strand:+ start:289 stop:618 length:330 start_codon:yes stop_codon:yes gene_type:complete